jgi:hypothetical protein
MCQQRASIFQVRLLAEHFTGSVVSVAAPVLTITPATSATVVNTQVFGDLPNAISILTKPVSGDFTGNIISGNIPGNAAFNPFNFKTLTATLTTTAATADVVPVLGMTSSGHCGITPTNTTAAKCDDLYFS